jgi:hypothetical protein
MVIMLAAILREAFVHPPSAAIPIVCAAAAVGDVFLALFLLSTGRASFVVSPDDITFTPRQGRDFEGAKPQGIRRTGTSTLSFRLQSNCFVGNQPSYLLRLRDDATQEEVAATSFGRARVRRACESRGWRFS